MIKILAAVVAALVWAAPAMAGTETVTDGPVSATLAWEDGEAGPQHTTLTITRAGVVAFAQPIPKVVCDAGCAFARGREQNVHLADLDRDGELEVLVRGFSGASRCCVLMGVYDFRPATGGYGELVRDWGPAGFLLDDLDGDGTAEFVSHDARFETPAAPPIVLKFERPARFTDVTRAHPAEIRRAAADARRRLRRIHRGNRDIEPLLGAYVAEQYLLGHGDTGRAEIDRQAARGMLGTPTAARKWRREVLALLRRRGYR